MVLGAVVGFSALVMSLTMNIGGVSETAATTFYAILFLVFLALGLWNIRRGRIVSHREWMIRAFGVALGVATTRPIIGAFLPPDRYRLMTFSAQRFGSGLPSPFWPRKRGYIRWKQEPGCLGVNHMPTESLRQ